MMHGLVLTSVVLLLITCISIRQQITWLMVLCTFANQALVGFIGVEVYEKETQPVRKEQEFCVMSAAMLVISVIFWRILAYVFTHSSRAYLETYPVIFMFHSAVTAIGVLLMFTCYDYYNELIIGIPYFVASIDLLSATWVYVRYSELFIPFVWIEAISGVIQFGYYFVHPHL